MTKAERIKQIELTTKLEDIIDCLNKAISPVTSKERICIICEQITALHGIIADLVKGGPGHD